MLFKKEKTISKWIKKVDAIITGIILGWIIASVYGIKKYEQSKLDQKNTIKKESFFVRLIKKLLWKK